MKFQKLGEQLVFSGSVISVGRATFSDPDSGTFEREVVHHPGAVAVVPLDGDAVWLVRQYRAATGVELLEIPAGKRDVDGEDLELSARRELAEEVGFQASRLDLVASFYTSPGFCDEMAHVFLASDLRQVTDAPQGIEERHMVRERVPLEEVPRLVESGEILDAKTIVGLLIASSRRGGARARG